MPAEPCEQGRFVSALLKTDFPVIMEIKSRAADGTDLLRSRSPAELVTQYTKLGAPAISVVTGKWFGGSAQLLDEVVASTALPVLVKDFFARRAPIARAAQMGASAVLLTASVLPRTVLPGLIEYCLEQGVTPFVEITTEQELARVAHAEHCAVAVNNKDIRRRERGEADLQRSLRLLPAVRSSGTPLPVSASGITSPYQAADLLAAGYRGVLVGTALLLAESPGRWTERDE